MNLNVYVITMAFHTFLINRIRKIEAEQEKDIFFKQVTHVMSRSHSKVNPINLIKSNDLSQYNSYDQGKRPSLDVESLDSEKAEQGDAVTVKELKKVTDLMTEMKKMNTGEAELQKMIRRNEKLERARKINQLAIITLFLLLVLFNVVFWLVAFSEYSREPEEYLSKGLIDDNYDNDHNATNLDEGIDKESMASKMQTKVKRLLKRAEIIAH